MYVDRRSYIPRFFILCKLKGLEKEVGTTNETQDR